MIRRLLGIILLSTFICSTVWAGYKVTGNLEVTGNVGIGTTSLRGELDVRRSSGVDGFIYGNGSQLTGLLNSQVGLGNVTNNAQVYQATVPLYVTSGNITLDTTGLGGSSLSGLHVNAVPVALTSSTIGDSAIYSVGANVGIGTSAPLAKLVIGNPLGVVPSHADGIDDLFVADAVEVDGNLYVDGALAYFDGNVGIGTSSPVGKLHIDGSIYQTTGNALFNINSGNTGIGDATPDLKLEVTPSFAVSSTAAGDGDRLIVTSAGNVGIGTTNPGVRLNILDSNYRNAALRLSDSNVGNTAGVGIDFMYAATGNNYKIARILPSARSGGGDLFIQTSSNGSADYATVLTATKEGNLGIGTTVPAQKLNVVGGGILTDGSIYAGYANNYFKQSDGGCSLCGPDAAGTTWACVDTTCPTGM